MLTRLFAAVVLCLSLSGCVLQSEQPIFSDADSKLLLASYGTRFASYTLAGGNWSKEEEILSFSAEGQHYVATDGKVKIDVNFVNISGDWWVVQVQEGGKPPNYALAEAQNGGIFIYPLACKAMREQGGFERFVNFKNDDCIVREGADTAAMFAALVAEPGTADMKLVPLP